MSTAKQTRSKIAKAIAYILVVLVVAGVIGVIVRFTGGFTSSFKTFYVNVDGKDILTSAGGYVLTPDEPMQVDIKYTFGKAGGDVSGYSVKVIPNAIEGKDFDFTLDEQVYSYQAETDLTGGFDIEYGETSFTIKPKGSITDILRAVYPNNEIGDCSGKEYADMLTLVVTSYNGESSVLLHFVAVSTVTFIELDQEVIVF